MHKLVYVFLIAFSGCFAGTQTVVESPSNNPPLIPTQEHPELSNETVSSVITLNIEQITNYQNLLLRLVDIDDSRCPTGVTCIWAGQLIVNLEVTNELEEKVMLKLIRKRESEIAYAFGYSLLLLDVAPHPKKDKEIQLSEQTVQIKLEKMQ